MYSILVGAVGGGCGAGYSSDGGGGSGGGDCDGGGGGGSHRGGGGAAVMLVWTCRWCGNADAGDGLCRRVVLLVVLLLVLPVVLRVWCFQANPRLWWQESFIHHLI